MSKLSKAEHKMVVRARELIADDWCKATLRDHRPDLHSHSCIDAVLSEATNAQVQPFIHLYDALEDTAQRETGKALYQVTSGDLTRAEILTLFDRVLDSGHQVGDPSTSTGE